MKTYYLIINYNDPSSVEALINNINCYSCLDKILIVDNKSTDHSLEKLEHLKSNKVEIIESPTNKGYGAGINFGVKYLLKKEKKFRVFISNADIVIEKEQDLKDLIQIQEKEKASIVAPTIIEKTRTTRGWKLAPPLVEIGLSIPLIYKKVERDHLFYPGSYYKADTSIVDAVSGCFFLVDVKALSSIDFFDENVFLYYEENIIASKLKGKGFKTVVANKVNIIHNHSVSIDKSLKRYQKYRNLKKSQEYYIKHYTNANMFTRGILFLVNRINFIIRNIVYRIHK